MYYFAMLETEHVNLVSVVWHEKGVCELFSGHANREEALKSILVNYPEITEGSHEVIDLLKNYFQGKDCDFSSLKLDFGKSTAFQKHVWEQTSLIPAGEVRTYGEIAALVSPGAQRAVGQALGKNPLPIIVP